MASVPQILDCPLAGIGEEFPDVLYVIHHPPTGKYGCYCHEGTHGLACFPTAGSAGKFTENVDLTGMLTVAVTFDEARDIAKERPLPIVSLILLDGISEPRIHYIR